MEVCSSIYTCIERSLSTLSVERSPVYTHHVQSSNWQAKEDILFLFMLNLCKIQFTGFLWHNLGYNKKQSKFRYESYYNCRYDS